MKISNNTILITGGTSGIGFELAAQFLALDNTVIITGREKSKLDDTKNKLPKVHTIQSDVSDPQAIASLYEKVTKEFPALNVIINNAGIMRRINLQNEVHDLTTITQEIDINLVGPIRMVKQFLPFLMSKESATIVNVSSGLAFVPLPISPIYCATKAGIHSFTQSLRIQLKNTKIKVFELAPPATETKLFRGDFTTDDLGGIKSMDVKVLAKHAIDGLEKDTLEICPGPSSALRMMNRVAPQLILNQMGKSVDKMLAQTKS